jgi:hypothetical protein
VRRQRPVVEECDVEECDVEEAPSLNHDRASHQSCVQLCLNEGSGSSEADVM